MDELIKFDFEAEKYVAASALIDKEALMDAVDILKPTDFLDLKNKEIYFSIFNLFQKDVPVDYLTVLADLRKRKVLAKVGSQYLADLSVLLPTSKNAKHYANIVRECSIRRQLNDLSASLANDSKDPSLLPQDLLERAEKLIFELAKNNSDKGFKSIKDLFMSAYERVEMLSKNPDLIRGIPTGFVDLDKILGGIHQSDFVVVGARPGVGKTALMLNIASNMAAKGKRKVGFFSLEMSQDQLVDRIISMRGKIDFWKIRTGKVDNDAWAAMSDVFGMFEDGDVLIDDTPGLTISDIRTKARKMKLENGLDALFIDYLQLIIGSSAHRDSNRAQEVAEISRSLKNLARELNIPVVTGSQVSRGVESRNDRKPQLSDLRESGAIEQDADVVIFLHREELYDPETEKKGKADVIIAKHRNGSTGNIELAWVKDFATFENLEVENYG
ncbi:MAG: replicative DNA helicase [bacterium]